jgi:hypothetical protein
LPNKIHVNDTPEFLGGKLLEARPNRHPCEVHPCVETAERTRGGIGYGPDLGVFCDFGGNTNHVAAQGSDLLCEAPQPILITRGYGQSSATPGELKRRLPANTARCSEDDYRLGVNGLQSHFAAPVVGPVTNVRRGS